MESNDRILKYLSGLLSNSESKIFEEELKTSKKLQEEFDRVKNSLAGIKYDKNIECSEAYFNNLIPKVRNSIETEKELKYRFTFRRALALGFVSLILLFLIFRQSDYNIYLPSDDELAGVGDSVINEYVSEDNNYLTYGIYDYDELATPGLNETDYNLEQYYIGISEDYNSAVEEILQEEDLQELIQTMSDKKIL